MVPWDTDTDHLQIHTNELHNYKWRKSTWRRACTWAMSFGLQSKENELEGDPLERGLNLGGDQAPKPGTQGWPLLWVELCFPQKDMPES